MKIVEGAYNGAKVISITQDLEYVAVELNPSMKFYSPVKLTYKTTGISFTAAEAGDIYFAYIPEDGGAPEKVTEYESITKDPLTGTLEIKGAKLHHFSRYSWVK